MRSRQKRALFQREFGAALLPRGFVYRENMFLRLHPGEVLLAVGLDLAPSGGGYVEYGALPFCNGISRPPFSGLARVAVRDGRRWEDIFHAREQWQVMEEQSAQLERQWRENPCARSMEAVRAIEELSYLKRFYEQYFSFFKDVFERFARVTSTREALAFHEWAIGFYNANPMPSILECVAVGEYEKALAYARFALERTQKTWQGNLQSRLDPPERGKRNAKSRAGTQRISKPGAEEKSGGHTARKTGCGRPRTRALWALSGTDCREQGAFFSELRGDFSGNGGLSAQFVCTAFGAETDAPGFVGFGRERQIRAALGRASCFSASGMRAGILFWL